MSNTAMNPHQDAVYKALQSAIEQNTLGYNCIADAIDSDLLKFLDLPTVTACVKFFQTEKTKHKSKDIRRPWSGDNTITKLEKQERHANVALIRHRHDKLKKEANDGSPDLNDPETFPADGPGAKKAKLSDEDLQQGPSAKRVKGAKGPAEDVDMAQPVPDGTDPEMAQPVPEGTAEDVDMAQPVSEGTAKEIAQPVPGGTVMDVDMLQSVPKGTAEEIAKPVPGGTDPEIAKPVPGGTDPEIAKPVPKGTDPEIAKPVPGGTAKEIAQPVPGGTAEDEEIAPPAPDPKTTKNGNGKGGKGGKGNRRNNRGGTPDLTVRPVDGKRGPNTGPEKRERKAAMEALVNQAFKRQAEEHQKIEDQRTQLRAENKAQQEAEMESRKKEKDQRAYKSGFDRLKLSIMSRFHTVMGRVYACEPSDAAAIALGKLVHVLSANSLLETRGKIAQIKADIKATKVFNKSDFAIFEENLNEYDAEKFDCNVFGCYRELIEVMKTVTEEELEKIAAYLAELIAASDSSKGSYGSGVAKVVCSTLITELVGLSKAYLGNVLQGSGADTPFVSARTDPVAYQASVDCMQAENARLKAMNAADDVEKQRGAPPGTTNGSENTLPETGAPKKPKVLVPPKPKGKDKIPTNVTVPDCWMAEDGSWPSFDASENEFSIRLVRDVSLRSLALNHEFAKAMFSALAALANANPNPMLREGQKPFEINKGHTAAHKVDVSDMQKQVAFWYTDIPWMIALARFCQGILKSTGRAGLKNVPASSETLLQAAEAKYKALSTKVTAETTVQNSQLARLTERFKGFENPNQFFTTPIADFEEEGWMEHAGEIQFSEEDKLALKIMLEKFSSATKKIKAMGPRKTAAFKELTALKKPENKEKADSRSDVTLRQSMGVVNWVVYLLHPFVKGSVEGIVEDIQREMEEQQLLLATPELRTACGDVADSALHFFKSMQDLKPIMDDAVICDTVRDEISTSATKMEDFEKDALLLYGSLQECIENDNCSEVDMQAALDAFVTGVSLRNESMLYAIVHIDGNLDEQDCAVAKTHLSDTKIKVLDLGNKLGVKLSDDLNVVLETDEVSHREGVSRLLTAEHAQLEMPGAPDQAPKETMDVVDAGKTKDVDAGKTEDVDAGKTEDVDAPLV